MPKTTKTTLDKTDIAIIVKLSQEAKATNGAIARDLSVSEETVRRRLARIVKEGHVRFNIKIDPRSLGFTENAVLTLKPIQGLDGEALNFAKGLDGITNAYRVFEQDGVKIVCEVSCVDVDGLNGLLDIVTANEGFESFRMQRIFDPEYEVTGYPGIR